MALRFLSTPRTLLGNVSAQEWAGRVFQSKASQCANNQVLAEELNLLEQLVQPDNFGVKSFQCESNEREVIWPKSTIKGTLVSTEGTPLELTAEKTSGATAPHEIQLTYRSLAGKTFNLRWQKGNLWWAPRLECLTPLGPKISSATTDITNRGKALLTALVQKFDPHWISD